MEAGSSGRSACAITHWAPSPAMSQDNQCAGLWGLHLTRNCAFLQKRTEILLDAHRCTSKKPNSTGSSSSLFLLSLALPAPWCASRVSSVAWCATLDLCPCFLRPEAFLPNTAHPRPSLWILTERSISTCNHFLSQPLWSSSIFILYFIVTLITDIEFSYLHAWFIITSLTTRTEPDLEDMLHKRYKTIFLFQKIKIFGSFLLSVGNQGWRDSTVVDSTGCFSRGARFDPQHPQLPVTLVSGDLMPPTGLCRFCMYVMHLHRQAKTT